MTVPSGWWSKFQGMSLKTSRYTGCVVSNLIHVNTISHFCYRYMKSGDQTEILRAGYWSSYNIPFYEDIYNMSGYFTAFEAHGTDFSYTLCPRAKIFRRDQGKVKQCA